MIYNLFVKRRDSNTTRRNVRRLGEKKYGRIIKNFEILKKKSNYIPIAE